MTHKEMVDLLLANGSILLPDTYSPEIAKLNTAAREQGFTLLISADGTYLAVNPDGEVKPFVVMRDLPPETKGAA